MLKPRLLPGIAFRAEAPPTVALPRMDVTALVGFAERGPLHMPVVVEDLASFTAIFGGVPRLAFDAALNSWQTACLPLAVRDFFAQGGRRCWVVRVTGDAETSRFPLVGLFRVEGSSFVPAAGRARCAGSWADGLRAGASLLLAALAFSSTVVTPSAQFGGVFSAARGEALQPGDLLQLDCANRIRAYVRVNCAANVAPPPGERGRWQRIDGAAYWFHPATEPEAIPGTAYAVHTTGEAVSIARAWRVTLALEVRESSELRGALRDLAFAPEHPRYWASLPDDETLYAAALLPTVPTDVEQHPALWGEAAAPRFPLAGDNASSLYLPLGLGSAPVWSAAAHTDALPLERDGLVMREGEAWANFIRRVFLDERLMFSGQDALLADADDILYFTPYADAADRLAKRLRGLHSVIPLDEVSLLALPDVTQRGWYLTAREHAELPEPEPTPEPGCSGHDLFTSCPPAEPPVESEPPLESLATAEAETFGAWWTLEDPRVYAADGLFDVQIKAAELAAARADLVAILSLPSHFRTRDALIHRRELRRAFLRSGRATDSYAALYHPHLVSRASKDGTGALRRISPDGAVCGIIAAKALARGAWIAPANDVIRDAVALTPPLALSERADLYNDGINLIYQTARGFTLMSASTLSDDADLSALNSRRLLILLRRLVLRDGQNYVFAPHSPTSRREVALGMERALEALFLRGAFAGDDPSSAYRVVVDATVNTRERVEAGEFIVELRVAPSQPMTFILVRLIQTGSGTLVVQEI